ncbi:MAG: archaeosortase/exosortase family protein [Acidobacteriota bacterium]
MSRRSLLLTAQLIAGWPVFWWYGQRLASSTDELYGLLALITVVIFLLKNKEQKEQPRFPLLLPTLITCIYALSYAFFPPLLRAVVAFTAIGSLLSAYYLATPLHLATMGLLLLSLPLIPSLQFYLGYPLRLLVALVSAPLIQMTGFMVAAEGSCLNWSGQLIWIDAPCSGIRMLWTGCYLTFTLCCFYELTAKHTCWAVGLSLLAILVGNILRAVALFYVEIGMMRFPDWMHEGVGVVVFFGTAIMIFLIVQFLGRRIECEPKLSS